MLPLDTLTSRGRIGRLRALVSSHVTAWELDEKPPRLMLDGFNTTFLVHDRAGERIVLRVHRPGWRTETMIRTELAWLEHLAATTSIIAPRPVPTRAGHPFVFARSPGVPDGRIISALRFVHGRLVGAKSSRKLAGSIGALAADLHVSTASRPELGSGVPPAHGLYTMIPRIWADLPPTLLTSRRRAILLAAEARIGACLESLATGDSVRLCHLDLHPHNLVRTPSGQLAPIDFDDCARAHPALDLGIALHYLRAHAPDAPLPVLCDELLAGYATRSTPPADSATVRTLADARQLMLLNQLCSETNPTLAAKLPDYVELAVRRLSIDA